MSSKKKSAGAPRDEAASLADEYRRRVFSLALAARRLSEVAPVVESRRVLVAAAAVADLEHARRLVAALGTPQMAGPKARTEGGDG